MKLKPKPPFNFDLTATNMYIMPPAKYINGKFSRILKLRSGEFIFVSVTSNDSTENPELFISVEPKVSKDGEKEIKEKISFMFSVEDDLIEFYSVAEKDPILKQVIKDIYGMKIQTTPTLFEGLVIGFCLQWISFQRGVKMIDCLIRKYGERVNDYCSFPTPESLAEAPLKELKDCKLGFRAERIRMDS